MQTAIGALILAAIAIFGLHMIAGARSRGKALFLAEQLASSPAGLDVSGTLPPLIRSFAQRAGVGDGPCTHMATFTQSGRFRRARGGRFIPFMAHQVVATGAPGFLWQARMRSGPLVFRVIDALVGGNGVLEVWLFGSLTVAKATGAEATLAEAYRYLAELPWVPDAMVCNPQLVWQVDTSNAAEVYIDTKAGRATVQFSFDAAGDIVGIRAKGRPARDSQNRPVRYDWQGRFGDYVQIGPRRVPRHAEIGYLYPSGYEPYFECEITGYEISDKPVPQAAV